MSALEAALRAIAAELDRQQVRRALVGGLAVTARAEPRTTRDFDVAVSVADDAASEDSSPCSPPQASSPRSRKRPSLSRCFLASSSPSQRSDTSSR